MSTTLLNISAGARTPTSTNPSSPPEESSSGPGTPASGISFLSTTAIKDGHEGHHPHNTLDVAAERVARLGGIGPVNASSSYFERPFNQPPPSAIPLTPSASSPFSDGRTTPEGDSYGANSTQAKRESMAAVIARRQLAGTVSLPASGQQSDNTSPAPSTATTQTTSSVAEARQSAKMIDAMTYDDGDTSSEGVSNRAMRPDSSSGALSDDVEMSG